MKRITLTILIACCALALVAQPAFRVKYKGAKPNIRNFAWAYLDYLSTPCDDEEDGCCQEGMYLIDKLKQAILNQDKGLPLDENETLTIDVKNGYLLYELRYEESQHFSRVEMCYWNESDGKHKLFALCRSSYSDGKPLVGQYDEFSFYRYDNAQKWMERCDPPGFDVTYHNKSYALPRKGKNIVVTTWNENGTKTQQTLKWNGRRFSY
ncbi:MAG: hypothetical protein IKW85_13680 [Muribaculaceae bacterium]|nr:hypothetical protein [Muribaculaceae bacterium]